MHLGLITHRLCTVSFEELLNDFHKGNSRFRFVRLIDQREKEGQLHPGKNQLYKEQSGLVAPLGS